MNKVYDSVAEMLESNVKKIEKKGDISKEDLCSIKEAVESIYYIEAIKGMRSGQYSEGHYSNSYGPSRSPVTGRYISKPSYGMPYVHHDEYSGHSIKDRIIARIEPMYDEAKTEYERQMVSDTIARIRSER